MLKSHWRLVALAVLLLGALALLLLLFWPQASEPKRAAPVAAAPPAPRVVEEPLRPRAPLRSAPPDVPGKPPVIDEVVVEKSSVCEGEENLVSVRAHTEDGTDGFLRYQIGYEEGARAPVRAYRGPDGESPRRYVRVFGKGGVVSSAPIPEYEIRPCRLPHLLGIEVRARPNAEAEFELRATITRPRSRGEPAPAEPFRAVRYEWDFGDETTEVTREPVVVHSYEDRPQAASYSTLLVKVTAVAANGERVTGRRSLQLLNPAFDDLARVGVVRLMTRATPREPKPGPDGKVTQRVRIFHLHDQPVYVDRVRFTRHLPGNAAPHDPEDLPTQLVLGFDEIPPGHGVEVTLTFDPEADRGLFMKSYELVGQSADGYLAEGQLAILRPLGVPTAEDHVPVNDPILVEKILSTRAILGKDIVTQDDIFQVERKGLLAHLQTEEGAPATLRNGMAVLGTLPGPPEAERQLPPEALDKDSEPVAPPDE